MVDSRRRTPARKYMPEPPPLDDQDAAAARQLGSTDSFLPWGLQGFSALDGHVRQNRCKRGAHVVYWAFYLCRHDSRLMWALPCKMHDGLPGQVLLTELTHTSPEHHMAAVMAGFDSAQHRNGLPNAIETDFALVEYRHMVAGVLEHVGRHRNEQKAASDKAKHAKHDAKRAGGRPGNQAKHAKHDAKRAGRDRAIADAVRAQRTRREHRRRYEESFDAAAEESKQMFDDVQELEADDEAATQAAAGEASSEAETLNPQHDQDAALALYNELNGHMLSWAADNPPPLSAGEAELAAWRAEVSELITSQMVSVDANHVRDLVEEQLLPKVGAGAHLCACASCGIRMAEHGYQCFSLDSLPNYFKLSEAERDDREKLGSIDLFSLSEAGELVGGVAQTDLRKIVTCYSRGDELYHLIPSLVEGDEQTGDLRVQLCSHRCAARVKEPKADAQGRLIPPACSLAAGVDFGSLDGLFNLPPLTDIEKVLLADVRMYAMVVKVVAPSNRKKEQWQHMKLRGHTIFFVQSGTEAAQAFVERTIDQRVTDLLHKVQATKKALAARRHRKSLHPQPASQPPP